LRKLDYNNFRNGLGLYVERDMLKLKSLQVKGYKEYVDFRRYFRPRFCIAG